MAKIKDLITSYANVAGQSKKDRKDKNVSPPNYNVDHTHYPDDLFSADNPETPYVMFYINVFNSSKIVQNKKEQFVQNNDEIQKQRKKGTAARYVQNQGGSGSITAATAFLAGSGTSVLTSAAKKSGSAIAGAMGKGGLAGTIASGIIVGVGVEAVVSTMDLKKSQTRLAKAIALPMPDQLAIDYLAQYKTNESANFLAVAQMGASISGGVGSMIKSAIGADTSNDKGFQLSAAGGAIQNLALKYLPGGDVISGLAGVAANPRLETTFTNVNPRTFKFDYILYARNQNELNNIHEIINTFKRYMLPEYKNDEFLFVYPAEFDIEYYMGAQQNTYIHKHTSCVLSHMTVNYTPDGMYNFFGDNGAPMKIHLDMTFMEIDIVTADDVDNGY